MLQVRHRRCLVVPLPVVAKTLPLPCVFPLPVVAKTLPLPCGRSPCCRSQTPSSSRRLSGKPRLSLQGRASLSSSRLGCGTSVRTCPARRYSTVTALPIALRVHCLPWLKTFACPCAVVLREGLRIFGRLCGHGPARGRVHGRGKTLPVPGGCSTVFVAEAAPSRSGPQGDGPQGDGPQGDGRQGGMPHISDPGWLRAVVADLLAVMLPKSCCQRLVPLHVALQRDGERDHRSLWCCGCLDRPLSLPNPSRPLSSPLLIPLLPGSGCCPFRRSRALG